MITFKRYLLDSKNMGYKLCGSITPVVCHTKDDFIKKVYKEWPDAISRQGSTNAQTRYICNGNTVGIWDEIRSVGQVIPYVSREPIKA